MKTTLNAKNLEPLGAARLAELLIEISAGSALAKRRLRLELAGARSPKDAAREIAKRLTALATARARVSWRSRKTLISDLETQMQAIARLAEDDPTEALELAWRLLQIATPIFRRCEDPAGAVVEVFHRACGLLGRLVPTDRPEALALAVHDALFENTDGQYDPLIPALAEALGPEGLALLEARLLASLPSPVPPRPEWVIAGYGPSGPVHAHEVEERHRQAVVRAGLQDIADARGDTAAFIAQFSPAQRQLPQVAIDIAQRLLAAGQPAEALAALDQAQGGDDWRALRLQLLETLARPDEAQAFRLDWFRQTLSPAPLRAYLRKLGDFEDVDAEEAALAHVADHPDAMAALAFLIEWPDLPRAAHLVQTRPLDGNQYEILTRAAAAVSDRFPLAATLALRSVIDFTLSHGRTSRYAHAARHLSDAGDLAGRIEDWGASPPHFAYLAKLKRDHGRKSGFWAQVG